MSPTEIPLAIHQKIAANCEKITQLLCGICAIPSIESQLVTNAERNDAVISHYGFRPEYEGVDV